MVCRSIDVTIGPSSIRDVCCFTPEKAQRFTATGPADRSVNLAAMLVLPCEIDSPFPPNAIEAETDYGQIGRRAGGLPISSRGQPRMAAFGRMASSEPPIETPEPGAPRVLGSGVELDADLGDRIPLHIAHDQFHGTEARAVADGWSAVEPARQELG
jgi:hypothetical protein